MARKNRDLSKEASLITEFPVPAFPVAQPDLDASELSDLARCFWAKSGDSNTWLSVVQHLMDTADIAAKLLIIISASIIAISWLLFGKGIRRRLGPAFCSLLPGTIVAKRAPNFPASAKILRS